MYNNRLILSAINPKCNVFFLTDLNLDVVGKGMSGSRLTYNYTLAILRCVIPVVWYNNKIKRVYHLFSLTELYLPSAIEYNTTCFGPRCGSSSGVTYR